MFTKIYFNYIYPLIIKVDIIIHIPGLNPRRRKPIFMQRVFVKGWSSPQSLNKFKMLNLFTITEQVVYIIVVMEVIVVSNLDSTWCHSYRCLKLYYCYYSHNALAQNRCNSIPCTVRISRQRLID